MLIFHLVFGVCQRVVGYGVDRLFHVGHGAEHTSAHPRFYVCAAPAGHDESYGHAAAGSKLFAEEVASGREVLHSLRRTLLPCVLLVWHVGGRELADGVVYVHEAHVGGGCRCRYLVGVHLHVPALHRHLHVALTCTQPHFTYHHVVQHNGFAVADAHFVGSASHWCLHVDAPFAIGTGTCGIGFLVP